jgi:hypothetical protein
MSPIVAIALFQLAVISMTAPALASAQTLSGFTQFDWVHSEDSIDQLNDADGRPLR